MALTATGFQADRHNLLTAVPANPAAGASLAWPCPANRVIQVVGARITLTTAVAAANRLLHVGVVDAAGFESPVSPALVIQTATLAWTYYFTTGIAPWDITATIPRVYAPLGCCYQIKTGSFFSFTVLNLAAADQLSNALVRYFEWYED